MFEIDDKLFGYISKSGDLTEDIVQRYKNSLIFIGDEKQIYVPTTNSYVGIGTSTIEDIKTSISSSDKIYISDYANNNLTDPNTTYYFPVINNTVPHTYYHTYVALNVGVNPVAGKFIGGLQGTADYAAVSDLTYKISTKVSSENRSYYIPFVNQMDAESYAYTNNRLLYNPHQEILISTYFSGTLRGRSTYAEYAYHATYTTYTTYSIFNSYQSIHRMDNVSSNYHITFASNNSYSLSYIDDTFYYNPLTNCVYAGNFYGTFHGDTGFTYLGNEDKQISLTIGITNKKLTLAYAIESTYADRLIGQDERNSDGKPQWYMLNKGTASLYGELCRYGGATPNMFEYRMTMTPYKDNTCGHPTQMAFNDNGAYIRTYLSDGAWNPWEHILTSGNSSVSGNGGSSWGDSITVTINNVTKTLTIPSNPNTDYLVRQLLSSSNNNYNLLFKWTNDNNDETSQARYTSTLYYNPSTKLLTNNGSLLIDAFNVGNETGIFFRSGFVSSDIYNCSILAYDHNNNGNDPDGLSINAYDGVSFCTGSNTRQERMRITSGGDIGIGTSSPVCKLHVNGKFTIYEATESAPTDDLFASSFASFGEYNDDALWIGKDTSHSIWLQSAYKVPSTAKYKLLLNPLGGNVGISTTNPIYPLHVDGNIYASGFRHSSVNSDDYVLTAGGGWKQWTTNNTGSAIVARDSSGNISGVRYYSDISDENIDIGSVYIRNTSDNAIRRISLSNFISKITSLVDTEDIVSFNKTLKVTEAWMDTGIITAESNFPKGNGTYAVQISHGTLNNGSDSWPAIYSGIMTIYNGTNGSYTDEVILHRSGHEGGKRLYLRTIQTASSTGYCKIQIAASANFGANATLTFKFRKLI